MFPNVHFTDDLSAAALETLKHKKKSQAASQPISHRTASAHIQMEPIELHYTGRVLAIPFLKQLFCSSVRTLTL